MSGSRIGSGFDAHPLVPGRPLILGGVAVVHDRGLAGHSDGDCLAHAICDALLGAAAAGDLGRHFPPSDPKWQGVSSLRLLEDVARIVAAGGFRLENVDATVIAEAPPLAAYVEGMRRKIAKALGVEVERVSVKAKSTNGLGAIGSGDGIAALATALLGSER